MISNFPVLIGRVEAAKVKEKVSVEENQVLDKADKVKEMKIDADKILQEALPTLHAAQEALNTLNRNVMIFR